MGDPLYGRVLRESWGQLAQPIRHLHNARPAVRARGRLRVEHGRWSARVLARALRLPRPAAAADAQLTITARGQCEVWNRSFDGRQFSTTQHSSGERELIERFGPFEFRFCLRETGGSLHYVQHDATIRCGSMRLRLPQPWAPHIEAREEPAGPRAVHVAVRAAVPGLGQLIAYDGVVFVEDVQR